MLDIIIFFIMDDDIKQEYEAAQKEYLLLRNKILEDIENSSYPLSLKCAYNKLVQIEVIQQSIQKTDDFYTSQILLRTLFEHYLVGFYVITRCRIEKSDSVGEEYYKAYYSSEFFRRETYNMQIDNIKNNDTSKVDLAKLKTIFPQLEFLIQSELDEIHRIANKFADIKTLGKNLLKLSKSNASLKLHFQLISFLERYNSLSSYIHGGPTAELKSIENDDILNEIVEENKTWGLICSTSLFLFIILEIGNTHSEYIEVYIRLRNKTNL